MNINERADHAAKLKRAGMCNCCQSVIKGLADLLGIDEKTVMSLGAGFAVGMGTMENTCGALIGAGIAAGIKTDGYGTVRVTREISELFKDKCGSVVCKELKGVSTGKVLCPCDECVRNAVLAFGEAFGIE